MLRPFWTRAALLASWLVLALPVARAATPDAEHVRSLVKQMDSDDFNERQKADAELRGLGVSVIPLLRAELAKKPVLEVERRLESMIRDLGRLAWHHDLGKAMQEARKTGKPLLVFSAMGMENGFGSVAARAMQRDTFADARVHARLPRDFVLCWHNRIEPGWEAWFLEIHAQNFPRSSLDDFVKKRLRGYAEGRGGGSAVTFFCTPDGRIAYPLAGYFGAERYLQEADAARKLMREGDAAKPARHAVASRLERLPAPEPMDKGLKAPCDKLLAFPYSDRHWRKLLRPNLLPLVDERVEPILEKLAGETALTH